MRIWKHILTSMFKIEDVSELMINLQWVDVLKVFFISFFAAINCNFIPNQKIYVQ